MARIIVTARSDGRGGFSPFAKYGASHAGETVAVAGRDFKVSSDGRVNIPASVMSSVGVMGPDGRYRVAVEIGARTDAGQARLGLFVSRPPESQATAMSGDVVPRSVAATNTIIPSETEEYYPPRM